MRSYQPAFELLEERIMLAAQPVVAISGATEAQLGAQTAITITFDNQPDGSGGSQNGYAPYVDLVLPHNGADGAGVGSTPPDHNDGISFASANPNGNETRILGTEDTAQFGYSLAVGNFDGDDKCDYGVFDPNSATWYLLQSTAGFETFQLGTPGSIPFVLVP